MEKLKFILNILFWTFEVLARFCGHAEEILKTYENYQDRTEKKKRKKSRRK